MFFTAYTTAYIISPRVAHRVVGYLEEEAIHSYTQFLEEIDAGRIENVPAPAIAIDYWRLPKDARLREVVVAVRADEAHHRDVNHYAAVSGVTSGSGCSVGNQTYCCTRRCPLWSARFTILWHNRWCASLSAFARKPNLVV